MRVIAIEGKNIETIKVFDINGKSIYKIAPIISNDAINIDLSAGTKGVYFINLKTDKGIIIEKIVIE